MEITVVGSGTVVPQISRRQSCVVVRAEEETLFFDLGSGPCASCSGEVLVAKDGLEFSV